MRIEMGLLQSETTGRPDGEHPGGFDTALEWLSELARSQGDDTALDEQQSWKSIASSCSSITGGSAAWRSGSLPGRWPMSDHALALMDFVAAHSPNPQWTASHEQYRLFVLFHRIQAAAMLALESSGPEGAIESINQGLERMHEVFLRFGAEEQFEQDELVGQLATMKESLGRNITSARHWPSSLPTRWPRRNTSVPRGCATKSPSGNTAS